MNDKTTDLRVKIVAEMRACQPRHPPTRMSEVLPESFLADVNAAIPAIPTATIAETNKLIYQYNNNGHGDAWPTEE